LESAQVESRVPTLRKKREGWGTPLQVDFPMPSLRPAALNGTCRRVSRTP
jgi:hypothetical protein